MMEEDLDTSTQDENGTDIKDSSSSINNEMIEALLHRTIAKVNQGEAKEVNTLTMPPQSPSKDTPKKKKFKRAIVQILSVIAISLGHFLDGSALAFTSPLLPQLMSSNSTIPINGQQRNFISSMHSLGATIGCLVAGMASRKFGRRGSVLIFNIPAYFIGYTSLAFARSVIYIYFGRLLCGFGIGFTLSVPTVYIVEITSPEIRGILGVLTNFFCQIGILCTYVAGYFIDWRMIAITMMIFCIPTIVFIWFIPESPVYYASIGKDDLARDTLEALGLDSSPNAIKALHERVLGEYNALTILRELKKPSVYKPFLNSIVLFFFFQCTAYPLLVAYAKHIFIESGIEIEENLASIIVGIVIVIGSIFSVPLAKTLPRKFLLLISGGGVAVSLAVLSIFFYLRDAKLADNIPSLPIVFFIIYLLFFMMGFGSISWLFIAEILPPTIRSTTYPLCIAWNWIWNFGFAHSFLTLLANLQMSGTFCLYAILSFIGFIFIGFFLPETRHKTSEEIAKFFDSSIFDKKESEIQKNTEKDIP
ncbi:facilitated trehalose transporter Tret1 isoform X1 [Lepeophtheirus salmonis]|uniref:Major facilitator superfamily (MFS) profile domain-containing protein n=1 Tax=Lepeophtheirus salmonis TaxID=72036 RepID=A0A0K2TDP4_LEPSM|nr:facilitated trehalose transporter Tret1-like isoform X2 [Lepeophtheirus salmonis]